ncbi:MAG: type II toxin-antitoxin system HipA family toxin [Deltaproteobacteria bacterium]|nr:type II toxin-antitoxin system HipA family toxin [Deltaproteobacteria bacterium]
MSDLLSVWWGPELVGEVSSVDGGRSLSFRYAPGARRAISLSLPLSDKRELLDGTFFANLLPEASERERLARALGTSVDNDLQLLTAIGGDCAGALSLFPRQVPSDDVAGALRPLGTELLISMRANGAVPVMVEQGLRLSLAGAQEKAPVVVVDGRLHLPEGSSSPSTHILKFPSRIFSGLVENELFIMRLARAVGLDVASVQPWPLPGGDLALLVERFDRHAGKRLHQEDLCQATGRSMHMKYEEEGGPSFSEVVAVVRAASAAPPVDIERLVRWQAFNTLVGNNDAHGKNVALLHEPHLRLAPAYDLVCTRAWPALNKKLAMGVGDRRIAGDVGPRAWALEAERCQLGKKLVLEIVFDMHERVTSTATTTAEALLAEVPATPVRAALQQVLDHCKWFASRRKSER